MSTGPALAPRSAAETGNSLRVWLLPRGTTGLPQSLTSVLLPKDALIDDLKWYIKLEMTPVLDKVPKCAIQVYYKNRAAEDYLLQAPHKPVAENPNPEVLKETPGLEVSDPLYWEWDCFYARAPDAEPEAEK
eukprot:TRINITY_DN451_c0_g1_i1.p2 TRINITY_DN451_c0_g1~~TRINITY_DN451_c0_g1_i1.p2  ORF type:complete len:150 (+),score=45.73 TRINITY_DN451_c0_g1_i1:55-450(+)